MTLLCTSALLLSLGMRAQISEVGMVPELLLVVRSVPTAGVKMYSTSSTGVTLYNLDLSIYSTITYPALPVGYTYFSVLYFTESTFDTDPSSIELMMLTVDTSYISGTRVFRDDGTILFDDLGLGFSGTGGYSELNEKPPLFTGEDGVTYMALTSYPTNPPTISKLFQLPGSLPCLDCASGSGLGLQDVGPATNEGSLTFFPNPASDQLTVAYTLPSNAGSGRLLLQDALGKLVANFPLDTSGRTSIVLSGYSNGSYTCCLLADGRVIRTRPLILTH